MKKKNKCLGRNRRVSKKERRVRREDGRSEQFFFPHYILETGSISLGSTENSERGLCTYSNYEL